MFAPEITYGKLTIPYKIKISDKYRSKIAIHVNFDGTVVVDAPPSFDAIKIHAAIQKRARWIVAHVDAARTRFNHVRHREYVSGEQIIYLGRRYVLKVLKVSEKPKPARLKGNWLVVETPDSLCGDVKERVRDWYRNKARNYLTMKTAELSTSLPWVSAPPPVKLLVMVKQWGSCSPAGRIILNPHLVKAPRECIEYVITHELTHLKCHDHSPKFWSLIDAYCPGWKQTKKRLDGLVEILTVE